MFVPELGLADILKSRSNGFLTGSEPPHEAAHYAMQAQSGCRAPRNSRCHCFAAQADDYRSRESKDVRVLVVGPTGYIGRFVTKGAHSAGLPSRGICKREEWHRWKKLQGPDHRGTALASVKNESSLHCLHLTCLPLNDHEWVRRNSEALMCALAA